MEQWERLLSQRTFFRNASGMVASQPWLFFGPGCAGGGLLRILRPHLSPIRLFRDGTQAAVIFKSSKVILIRSHSWKPHLRLRILLWIERENWVKKFVMAAMKIGFRTELHRFFDRLWLVAGGHAGPPRTLAGSEHRWARLFSTWHQTSRCVHIVTLTWWYTISWVNVD